MQKIKIISGGQTGADQGGLYAAEKIGFEIGGEAPNHYRTETGNNPKLLRDRFGLTESGYYSYVPRTVENVKNSDITMIFSHYDASAGTKQTIRACKELHKKYILVDPFKKDIGSEIIDFIVYNNPNVINIAGNRESVCEGIQRKVCDICFLAFHEINTILED